MADELSDSDRSAPAVAALRESCRALCEVGAAKAIQALEPPLDTQVVGHISTRGLGLEIPRQQGAWFEDVVLREMTNAFELRIPLVVNPSRGLSLVTV